MTTDTPALNAIQQVLFERFGAVIQPPPPRTTPRTAGDEARLAHQRQKRAHAAGIENPRDWRRALGI